MRRPKEPDSSPDGWRHATPEDVGLDSAVLGAAVERFTTVTEANLHSLLVARHGALVYENYFVGEDEAWGDRLGRVSFDAGTKHDVRSITKSVTALLVGIAIRCKLIRSVDEPVFATKALRKFLTCLTSRESPVLLDLARSRASHVPI